MLATCHVRFIDKKTRLLAMNKIIVNSLNIVSKRFIDNSLVATRLSL